MKNRLPLLLGLIILLSLNACSSKKAAQSKPKGPKTEYIVKSNDKQLKRLLAEARSWIGTPYAYARADKGRGTDCSGFIMSIFNTVYDIKLPRSAAMQCDFSRSIKFDRMQPGDLVFFNTSKNSSRVNHVGLYIGNGRMIHASASRGVMESALNEKYWQNTYHSSGAVIDPDRKTPKPEKTKSEKTKPEKTTPRPPAKTPSISARNLQQLYNALDYQIDSLYVTNPEIFD